MSPEPSSPATPAGRILVIRGGAIGDFVVTLPVFAALRCQFPTARLELMGYPHIARLAALGGLVDAIHPIESRPLAGFFARNGSLDPGVSEQLSSCSVIFSYLFDPDEIFRTNVGRVTRAQVVQAPHRPYETSPMSASAQLLVPLERLGIFDPDPVPRLPLRPGPPRTPRRLGLHPGSGGISKNWSRSNWRTLVERLVGETDLEFLLVGGEAEVGALDELAPLVPEERRRVLRNRPLDEVATHLAGCGGFLGHDSGITHLAAAVGTPVLALWGPSVEHIWKPGGNHVQTLRPPGGLGSLEPETVLRRLGEILPR
jgi:heptosyltransferase-2